MIACLLAITKQQTSRVVTRLIKVEIQMCLSVICEMFVSSGQEDWEEMVKKKNNRVTGRVTAHKDATSVEVKTN